MDPIEKAIRNALEKGDAKDPAFREKVYRSVFAALDRSLKANPELTVETAIKRRKALQTKIAEIEAEHLPKPAPEVASPRAEPRGGRAEPSFEHDEESHARVLPAVPDIMPEGPALEAASPGLAAEPDYRGKPRRRKRPFIWAFIAVTVLAIVVMAGLWAYNTGLFLTAAERDTAVRTQPNTEAEDYDPEEGNTPPPLSAGEVANRNWITVFTPSDPTTVTAPSQTTAEAMQDESGAYMRIGSGASGSAVIFDIGQGVLEQIAGKTALFDIIARAEGGGATQISIDCNFGELGDCGRKRYEVNYERNEYLFEVDMPNERPGAGGTIAINSDFERKGRAVDIYEIRVSVSE
ncbi:hypothetical protein [Oryzicola mucosus]|uniref:Uncharacterized protein n=1 Tax=Oryzicola mucosus TaxID=2767425 RepID=A0A8J6PH40_9HYPH|nr:hypothetical protein [Oryzicola mucosus]MBD0413286.1 hypothetical protein [Oryzicola mucosus]